ncbi:MAG: ABC transporter ATP-binding protein [Proteobacteria bacterium]|nr:ABC transporter ATP-binding protein [Pseudomonadota bacterium]
MASGRPDVPLQAEDIGKSFVSDNGEELEIIRSVSFALARGEIVSLVGPSGCGKTTLLNLLCRLLEPTHGAVFWKGEEVTTVPAGIGYMLQKDLLLPWRTAIQNVMLGLQVKGGARSRHRERANALLEQLGLEGFGDHYPSTLSGGMRQRVALARTLAPEPEVLLFDEPFSALDFQTKILIERDTLRLVRELQRSLLLITHDVEEAVSLSDRVIVLSRRPCTIVSEHRIDLPGDRSNLIALRESKGFAHYVRQIWTELDIR